MKYSGGRRSSNTTTENDDGREATESYSRPLAENERERGGGIPVQRNFLLFWRENCYFLPSKMLNIIKK